MATTFLTWSQAICFSLSSCLYIVFLSGLSEAALVATSPNLSFLSIGVPQE